MCVCMCVYVRMYINMYIRMYLFMHGCMYVYVCMYGFMYVFVYVCMYVCMYVFVCLFLFVSTLLSLNSPQQHKLTHKFLLIIKPNSIQDRLYMHHCFQYTHFSKSTILRAPNNKTVLIIGSNQIRKSIKFESPNVTDLLPTVIISSP